MILNEGELCLVQFKDDQRVLEVASKIGNQWYTGDVFCRYLTKKRSYINIPMEKIIKTVNREEHPEYFLWKI